MTIKVLVQQPVLAKYRLPFFRSLGKVSDIELTVLYSPSIPGFPQSIDNTVEEFEQNPVYCKTVLGNRFFIQKLGAMKGKVSDFDVVVVNSNPRFLSNFSICRTASRSGCHLVSWNHAMSSTSGSLSSRARLWHTKRQFSHHFVYTDPEIESLVAHGFKKSTITALNNTIDTTEITDALSKHHSNFDGVEAIQYLRHNLPDSFGEVLRSKGLDAGNFFLFCGRLTAKARVNQLLEACSKIDSGVKFVIVGDGVSRGALEEECKRLEIEDRVTFVGAIEEQAELAPYFLGAKAMVYPGSIGLSLNHAFAFGLPVVTHDDASDHMPEFYFLRPGENGFVFEQNDINGLASVLQNLKGIDLSPISRNSLDTVYTRFTFDGMVDRFASALRLVASR